MNVGDQNGLEAWRLLVRSEQPVSGANRIAAMQCILQFKFSPGFDKLEEELRTFEGLVKTYQAIFAQAVIKSQVPGDIRTHLGLQTFRRTADLVNLMSSLSKMRTAATSSSSEGRTWSDADGKRLGQGQKSGQEQEQGERKRQRKMAKKKPRTISLRDGVTTAENGSQSSKLLAWRRETGAPSTR